MGERYIEPCRVLCDSISQFPIARGEIEARVASQTTKLVASLEAEIAEFRDDETVRKDYSDWLEVARRPLPIHEIEEPLFEVACEAWDARLAALPLPNGARPVATAPLPPLPDPPGSFEIPPGATLMDALTPAVARGARRALAAVHGYLLEMAKVALRGGQPSEVPKPILSGRNSSHFAVGVDGCRAWARRVLAAGHTLESGPDGKVRVRDASRPPEFFLRPSYWSSILDASPDLALRDAMTTHGVVHHTWSH